MAETPFQLNKLSIVKSCKATFLWLEDFYVSLIDVLYYYFNKKQCINALIHVFTLTFFVYWNLLRASEFGYVITVTISKDRF